MVDRHVDVLVVGGGLTGAAFMLAMAHSGYDTLLIDANKADIETRSDFDARSLALSPASVRILTMLGVWPSLSAHATAIHRIHVSEQKQFGMANLKRKKEEPLGFVIEMQHIDKALKQLVSERTTLAAELTALDTARQVATVKLKSGETISIKTNFIVAADGARSRVRQLCGMSAAVKDYQQSALVANMGLARHHQFCAYERFTRTGPLALLPMSDNRSSLVWSLPTAKAQQMMDMSENDFIKSLHKAFGYRLGRFTKAGQRTLYPLYQVIMRRQTAWPLVFVGNAAHTLHPVAGQGLNLALRDVALLAQCMINKGINPDMLDGYQRMRQHDQTVIAGFTNGLVDLFTSKIPGLGMARGAGLMALDNAPSLKNLLSRYASGFGGVTPDLACHIPLMDRDV